MPKEWSNFQSNSQLNDNLLGSAFMLTYFFNYQNSSQNRNFTMKC